MATKPNDYTGERHPGAKAPPGKADSDIGATEKFWAQHGIKSGRDQPGNPKAQSERHPGFANVQAGIAKETNPRTGKAYGPKVAGAILGARTRAASPAAKKANPRLKNVKG